MKKYNVKVNGVNYEVEIEEVGSTYITPVQNVAPVASAPVVNTVASAAISNINVEGEAIKAPLPGNILSINVSAGQTVKSGDVLMVLEAMKMENEILAPRDGVVASVAVSKGATVGTGDVLASLK